MVTDSKMLGKANFQDEIHDYYCSGDLQVATA